MATVFYSDTQQRRILRVFPDLVRHRGLLYDLVSKELRARYRNAMMGFFWAVLQPLLMALILTFVWRIIGPERLGDVGLPDGIPFAVIVLCGLIPWQLTFSGLLSSTASLVLNQNLIKKVYFPREVIPLAALGNCLVNYVIGLVLVLVVHVLYGGGLTSALVWVPVIFVIQFVLVCGLGLLLSCLNAFFHDVGYLLEVALMFGFYASPVFYPIEFLYAKLGAEHWACRVYLANPMAGLLSAYRECMLYGRTPSAAFLIWPAVAAVLFLALGLVVFRRNAPRLADHL